MYKLIQFPRAGRALLAALLVPTALAAAAAPPDPAAGAAPTPVAATPATGPAMDQLRRMATFLSGLKTFSLELRAGYDVVQDSGQKIEFGETRQVTLVRPDRLRVEVRESDGDAKTLVFDGQTVTLHDPGRNVFAAAEVPGGLDRSIPYFIRDLGMRLPLAMLLVSQLPQELERRVQSADIVETSVLGDVPAVHLAARGETVDLQIWIPAEGDPLPRRILLTYKEQEGQPQYWAELSNWNLAPDAPAARFQLEIPSDAVRVAFLPQIPDTAVAPADATPGERP